MMKKIIMAAFVLCVALMAASCIYPFTPEVEDGSGTLVVEGDIFIGEFTSVSLSYAAPIGKRVEYSYPNGGEVWVEDDAGTMFFGQLLESDSWQHSDSGSVDSEDAATFRIDTRDADPSRSFRLHVMLRDRGREYVSSWEKARPAPVIDSLSYNLDFDRSRLNIALSMHSGSESYFKWDYIEDWEYHAMNDARLKAEINRNNWWGHETISVWDVRAMDYAKENLYYCYGHEVSKKIMIFSTEKQTDDRFVDLEFRPIPRDDLRISYLYRIAVMLEPLSPDAYKYWQNINANSDYGGDLFAPNPSEMVGNIRCVQDPDVFVIGYISVAQRARKELTLDAADHKFFKLKEQYAEERLIGSGEWTTYYVDSLYRPYRWYIPDDKSQTYWLPERCVDCMKRGTGSVASVSRNKPDNWPPQ